MFTSENWKDYELLDVSDGERLERWGDYILIRPDPSVIWKNMKNHKAWSRADAVYSRSKSGGGSWEVYKCPEEWTVSYNNLKIIVRPTGFKHTGIFPEQAANWDFITDKIKNAGRKIKVLNLFAYTGVATVAAAKAGAEVCHVDAAKGMVAQARRNAELSGLADAPIRYIVDDCSKFVAREFKRGNRYDGIIMDPPSYGRGPNGEVWKLEDCVGEFIKSAESILSDNPLFFIVNSYTTGLSPSVMGYMLQTSLVKKFGGKVTSEELGIKVEKTGFYIPSGAAARWESK